MAPVKNVTFAWSSFVTTFDVEQLRRVKMLETDTLINEKWFMLGYAHSQRCYLGHYGEDGNDFNRVTNYEDGSTDMSWIDGGRVDVDPQSLRKVELCCTFKSQLGMPHDKCRALVLYNAHTVIIVHHGGGTVCMPLNQFITDEVLETLQSPPPKAPPPVLVTACVPDTPTNPPSTPPLPPPAPTPAYVPPPLPDVEMDPQRNYDESFQDTEAIAAFNEALAQPPPPDSPQQEAHRFASTFLQTPDDGAVVDALTAVHRSAHCSVHRSVYRRPGNPVAGADGNRRR